MTDLDRPELTFEAHGWGKRSRHVAALVRRMAMPEDVEGE